MRLIIIAETHHYLFGNDYNCARADIFVAVSKISTYINKTSRGTAYPKCNKLKSRLEKDRHA